MINAQIINGTVDNASLFNGSIKINNNAEKIPFIGTISNGTIQNGNIVDFPSGFIDQSSFSNGSSFTNTPFGYITNSQVNNANLKNNNIVNATVPLANVVNATTSDNSKFTGTL